MMFFQHQKAPPQEGTRAIGIDVTQEQIESELRTMVQHQKILLELDQVLWRIGTEPGWSRTPAGGCAYRARATYQRG
jgi:hypothetical protein